MIKENKILNLDPNGLKELNYTITDFKVWKMID